jgi:succinoglycan biosynthesis transport protein ExoP
VTPIQYLRAFRRSWWLIALCAVAGTALSLLLNASSTPTYTSTATVLLSSVRTSATTIAEASQGDVLAQQRVASYADIARGPALAKDLVDELHLDLTPSELRDQIDVVVPNATTVLRISVDDVDPEQAQLIASRAATSIVTVIDDLEKKRGQGNPLLRASVAAEAQVPSAATAPPAWRNPALGAAAGVAVGLWLAVVRSRLDRRIRDESAARETLGVPLLGVLPVSRSSAAIGRGRGDARWDEAIRELRTSIYFLHPGADQCLTLAIASPHPIDQLARIAGEVAAALVDTGARVLLVDTDLHAPRQTPLLGPDAGKGPGLGDYLTATSTEEDAIHHDAASGVDVLPSGTTPPNPADLLHSEAFAILVKAAAQRYDFVLVTTAATSLGTDAAAVAARCDGTLVAMVRRDTSRRQVRSALGQLERVDAPVLGGVFLS